METTTESAPRQHAEQPMTSAYDVDKVRADFPALHQLVHKKPLVYLDSAATALKPQSMIDAVTQIYAQHCGNVHRAVHTLSQSATAVYEGTRDKVQALLNASEREEIMFVRGTTEGINLVAQSWGRANLGPGDEVVVTELEHHSNMVPWHMVCAQTGARLVVVPVTEAGEITLDAFDACLSDKTKLVAMSHVSNVLGTVLPIRDMIARAHERGAVVLVDGAQGVVHGAVDVQALDCDFYVFSGHKLYGPTGTGALYGKRALLEEMPPWMGGGDMIGEVTIRGFTHNELPYKFEAGTPSIASVVGLGASVDYVTALGMNAIAAHEQRVLAHGLAALSEIPGLRFFGTAPNKASVISFAIDGVHTHDMGTLLDAHGIALRTGHHCAQPLMQRYGVTGMARASIGLYSRPEDFDVLVRALHRITKMFS